MCQFTSTLTGYGLLVAYLIGLPILGYSLDLGKEHVNLVDERLQELIYSGQLDDKELDRYELGHLQPHLTLNTINDHH